MKKTLSFALALLCLTSSTLFAQQPSPTPTDPPKSNAPPEDDAEGVVKIGTSLVQIDAVVTDGSGKIIRNLKAEDFEISENGKRQDITNFSFVEVAPTLDAGPQPAATDPNAPVTARKLKPDEVRRTIVIVVDDLGIGVGDVEFIRRSLVQFVEKQMGPNDLVSIIRTSSGSGTLQQLTNNRQFLLAGIRKIYPRDFARDFNQTFFSAFPVLSNAIKSLQKVPGRKSIIFVSDGLTLNEGFFPVGGIPLESTGDSRLERFRQLVDQANRSSVVINTFHSQAQKSLNYDSATTRPYQFDRFGNQIPFRPNQPVEELTTIRQTANANQDGLLALAKETGGIPIRNTNDFSAGFQKILNDQSGYYLIGYSPDEEIFKAEKNGLHRYRSISVKVKRSGLTVRSRKGFRAVTDAELTRTKTPETRLVEALASPFKTSDLKVQLTSLFVNENGPDGKPNAIIRSLLFYDASDLTFQDDGDGWMKAEVGLFAMIFDDNGGLVERVGRTQNIRLRGKALADARKNGLVYTLDIPVRKAGAYQIRAAVRDNASQKIGSASQYIETPRLEKDRLSLSGLVLLGLESKAAPNAAPQLVISEAPSASPAVREFVRGGGLSISCFVYNPVVHPQTRQPSIKAQIKLFREGKEIYSGKEFQVPFSADGTIELNRAITLAESLEPGEYVALVTVTDLNQNDSKRKTARQWLDFTIVGSANR